MSKYVKQLKGGWKTGFPVLKYKLWALIGVQVVTVVAVAVAAAVAAFAVAVAGGQDLSEKYD